LYWTWRWPYIKAETCSRLIVQIHVLIKYILYRSCVDLNERYINSMPKIMRDFWPNWRRRLGRPLKRLLDETETSLLTLNSWRIIIIIIVIITISRCVTRGEEGKVHMLCLFVLLVKIGWRQGEALESEEVVMMGSDWYVRSMQNRKDDQHFVFRWLLEGCIMLTFC
jgi:hypothetical protein